MRELILRADGNAEIGLGHIIRSLSLGAMFAPYTKVTLYTKWASSFIRETASSMGVSVLQLKKSESFSDFRKLINDEKVVSLDDYSNNCKDELSLKSIGARVITISDDNARQVESDALINHGIGAERLEYKGPKSTQYLLGPEFALLRPEILMAAERAEYSKRKKNLEAVICFGGADPLNLTKKYLAELSRAEFIQGINAVVGEHYRYFDELIEISKTVRPEVRVLKGINAIEMQEVMQESDLAVVPSSGVLLEVLAMKLNVITGYYVDNQKGISDYLKKNNILLSIGDLRSACLDNDIVNNALADKYRHNFVDGRSAKRILRMLRPMFND